MRPVVYAADIGSVVGGNFGWARVDSDHDSVHVEHSGGTEIDEVVAAIAQDLNDRRHVALGLECPLFIPVPADRLRLGKARPGEGSRPWSGGPGTSALATGLVEAAWILSEIRRRCPASTAFLNWEDFSRSRTGLFLWEAFVTGEAKATTHVDDAVIAATSFRDALPDPSNENAVDAERPLSLLGAALLWSGWSDDLGLLHEPCLVIESTPPSIDQQHSRNAGRAFPGPRPKLPPLHERLRPIAEKIPSGSWTTYGDAAAMLMIPNGALAVGQCLANHVVPNAHRILNADGKVAKNFAFPDGRADDPMELLKAEGIRFTNGKADVSQRWQPNG